MSGNNIIGNRNSTPEVSRSSLQPPGARGIGNGHHLRASADMSGLGSSSLGGRSIRPSSEVYLTQSRQGGSHNSVDDAMDQAAQQWIADIDQYEITLEDMAAAALDQDFKDELNAIEQWFKVLSEAERTAALYSLLQQTTQVQIRFFIQVLQEMANSHPMAAVLTPANFNEKGEGISKLSSVLISSLISTALESYQARIWLTLLPDPMASRMNDAMGRLSVDGSRNSIGRPPGSASSKRNSGLDAATINSMFPDAAAAIAKKKAEYTQQTGNAPTSNRNSLAFGDRSSLIAPIISGPMDSGKEGSISLSSPTPWGQRAVERPKSSSGQPPMGQFSQPLLSAGLRSPRPTHLFAHALQPSSASLSPIGDHSGGSDLPLLSPYNPNASWASMTNTPMVPTFSPQATGSQADMVANATAMKLAALSTVNNRIMLDDVRKYRRARSNDGGNGSQLNSPQPMGMNSPSGTNVLVVNEAGQLLNSRTLSAQELAALQMQQQAVLAGHRSRPNSPGFVMQGSGIPSATGMGGFISPQNNGYLSAYDSSAGLNTGVSSLGGFSNMGHEGYISDHSDARGRSPRGRRGSSKPPEDPTDLMLLQDIPNWLRSLRLHKYTDNLKDLKWEELVELDDKGLDDRGVNALGARRKMLKVKP